MNLTHSYYMSFLHCSAIVLHYHLDMSWIEDYNSTLCRCCSSVKLNVVPLNHKYNKLEDCYVIAIGWGFRGNNQLVAVLLVLIARPGGNCQRVNNITRMTARTEGA